MPAIYSWTSRAEWMGGLAMADMPGHMLWAVNGRKFTRIDKLPADFRAALEARVPGALARRIDWSDFPAR